MANVWRAQFAGNDPTAAGPIADGTPAASATSKRKGELDGPKSAEALALDAKVAEQGNIVRELKARAPRTKELEEETAIAIAELKKLKAERAALPK